MYVDGSPFSNKLKVKSGVPQSLTLYFILIVVLSTICLTPNFCDPYYFANELNILTEVL